MQTLNSLFHISYGTKLDKNKTYETNKEPILFVSRTSKNHGIDLICEKQIGLIPNLANTISVPLGGEGRLTANVQFNEYYNGQNVAILTPKIPMTLNQRIYYSLAIRANQFKYSAFGREANSTLGDILLPSISELPDYVYKENTYDFKTNSNNQSKLTTSYKIFSLFELFDILKGNYISEEDAKKCPYGNIAFVSSGRFNNGVKGLIQLMGNETTIFPENSMTLAKNGSVGVCHYHEEPIVCTSDVLVLKYKFKNLTKYEGLFFKVLIEQHIFRFNYGRKITKDRLKEIQMPIPFKNNKIDYEYINNFIKSKDFSDCI